MPKKVLAINALDTLICKSALKYIEEKHSYEFIKYINGGNNPGIFGEGILEAVTNNINIQHQILTQR